MQDVLSHILKLKIFSTEAMVMMLSFLNAICGDFLCDVFPDENIQWSKHYVSVLVQKY